MTNPFIPKGKNKICIVDGRIDDESYGFLRALGLEVIKTIACRDLYESIAYHPDIVLHPIGQKTLVVAPNVYDDYYRLLKPYGLRLIKGETYLGLKYPYNIAYNVARLGRHIIHKTDSTDSLILQSIQEDQELLNVRQGYSKCSLGLIGSDLGITSDRKIYEALVSKGYRVLLIEAGHIDLPGENYGFIGGAMGNLGEDHVIFSGSLDSHPSGREIREFSRDLGRTIIEMPNEKLIDYGTILILDL